MSAVLTVDRASLLASIDGRATLGACEAELRPLGLTLDVALDEDRASWTLALWLARGAPGARDAWLDPADHLVAGVEATLRANATRLTIRPSPRRAVGPDLLALILGMNERFATVTHAWIRVHPLGAARPVTAPFTTPQDPPLSDEESKLLDAIDRTLAAH